MNDKTWNFESDELYRFIFAVLQRAFLELQGVLEKSLISFFALAGKEGFST